LPATGRPPPHLSPFLLLIFFSILLHAPFSASAVSPKRFVSLRMRAAWPSSSFAIEAGATAYRQRQRRLPSCYMHA
jgi:hypothetical protein